jgi:nascent polypeptide-associated complex subunit alpha
MFPGVNPRQMQQMMRKMGIQQVDIPAKEVIIRTEDKELIFHNPSVAKVNMMGQETYQIVGEPEEREHSSAAEISQDDIDTVVEQTGASEDEAREAIEEAGGDLAEAIIKLKKE